MNLNHEIVIFQDIDLNSSKINMRMMLRGDKIIKKYKSINFNLNDLNKNIKERKIIDFPYKSKLVFNYNLTNDKNTVSLFIKDAKYNRENKKTKSIFESNEDDDENCEEESEDSQQEKKESDNEIKQIQNKINNNNKNNKSINVDKSLSFRERLSLFEKQPYAKGKNNIIKPPIKNENLNKPKIEIDKNFQLKIEQIQKQMINNGIIKHQTMKIINKNNELDDKNKNMINIKKNETIKKDNIIINSIGKVKLDEKKETKNNKNINEKQELKISNDDKDKNEINKNKIIRTNQRTKTNVVKENSIKLKSKILNENIEPINSNIIKENAIIENQSEQVLTYKKIDVSKEKNIESFCNSFFICSFPYKKGKILENSKNYRSICNHPICGKLIAMEPEIIFKYPQNDTNDLELNNLSSSICFPTGIKICYNQERRNIYKSFYTHIISQQGQKYYMVIYHFYRKLDSMNYNQ